MRCGFCSIDAVKLNEVDKWGSAPCHNCGTGNIIAPPLAPVPIGSDDLSRYRQEVEAERAEDLAVLRDHAAVKRDGKPRGG